MADVNAANVVQPSEPSGRLPLGVSVSFGVGTVGVSCLLNTITIYLPSMMATVLGLSTALAGTLLAGAKLYDIFADVAIGTASDRTRSRMGRRRPYLFAGAIISSAAFAAIFAPPTSISPYLVWYMLAALLIYSTGYSLFNIPYLAMPAEMTNTAAGRTGLVSYRTFFISVGQLVSVSGAAALIAWQGGGARGYAIMGWTLTAVIAGSMLITFFGTARAPIAERSFAAPRLSVLAHARALLANRPFVLLMAGKWCQMLGFAATSSTVLLFFLNVLHIGYQGLFWYGIAFNLAMAASIPFWPRIALRFGKRRSYMVVLALSMVVTLTWLIPSGSGVAMTLALRGAATGVLSGGALLIGVSMLTDTMVYDRRLTGHRREGLYSSVYAIIEKLAYAIGPAISGIYLATSGYLPTKGGQLIAQPASAILALYVGLIIIPVALTAIQIGLLAFYDLDDEGHERRKRPRPVPAV